MVAIFVVIGVDTIVLPVPAVFIYRSMKIPMIGRHILKWSCIAFKVLQAKIFQYSEEESSSESGRFFEDDDLLLLLAGGNYPRYKWWLGALSIGPRIFEYVCI